MEKWTSFTRGKKSRLHRTSGEGDGTPLHYSCLGNPMDGRTWWAAVHGVARSRTRLSDLTFTFHLHALEKEMATHSSVLAWRIPGSAEPGGLLSMGSHRVGHDWRDLAAAAAAWSPYSVTISAEFQRPLEALAQLFAVLLFMACFSTAHCILLALIFLNLSLCDCLWTWWQLWLW